MYDVCIVGSLSSVKPENFKLTVNDSTICRGDVISITCSAEGKPAVHTYQLCENEIPVNDGNSSAGEWTRVMSTAGEFTFRCVANNTVGTSQKNDTVTVKGSNCFFKLHVIHTCTVHLKCTLKAAA